MQKTGGLVKLVAALQDLDGAADALAKRLTDGAGSLAREMATTTTIVETVEKTRDQLREVNRTMMAGDNGGPAGPLPGSPMQLNASGQPGADGTAKAAQAPSQGAPDAALQQPGFERTAIGFVSR